MRGELKMMGHAVKSAEELRWCVPAEDGEVPGSISDSVAAGETAKLLGCCGDEMLVTTEMAGRAVGGVVGRLVRGSTGVGG